MHPVEIQKILYSTNQNSSPRNPSGSDSFLSSAIKKAPLDLIAARFIPQTKIETTADLSMDPHPHNMPNQTELGHSLHAYWTKNVLTYSRLLNPIQREKELYSFLGLWILHHTTSICFTINKFNLFLSVIIFLAIIRLSTTAEKVMEQEGDDYINCSWCL